MRKNLGLATDEKIKSSHGQDAHATLCIRIIGLILLQCVVIGAVGKAVAGDPALTVVLRPLVQVEDGTMTLGNVAEVFGSDVAGTTRLREVTLGRAPALGETRTMMQDDVVRYCLRSGFKKEDINVSGAQELVVSRACDTLTPDALSQVIERYLSGQLTQRGIRYNWAYSNKPDPVAIPVGVAVDVIPKVGVELQGATWLQIGVRKDDLLEPVLSIRVDISTHETLWVAKQTIPRGTSITKDLIQSQEVETTWLVGNPRAQVESIIGYRAKRTISAGKVIASDMIDIPYAIRRGDLVTINAYAEGVVASVGGQARQDGRPGDWIWVVNLLTRSKIKAQVVDGNSVVIP